jgi:hypothetical protein
MEPLSYKQGILTDVEGSVLLTSSLSLLILLKGLKSFLIQSSSTKHAVARRSTVLSFPLQIVFPGGTPLVLSVTNRLGQKFQRV